MISNLKNGKVKLGEIILELRKLSTLLSAKNVGDGDVGEKNFSLTDVS